MTCEGAAKGGHLDVLKWARANGCEWDEDTCVEAVKGGHLEVLQWARENGCEWSERTCEEAAWGKELLGGHAWGPRLDVLQWLRANGCPWDASTCMGAADGGHLEVLKWARENGCEWDEDTCEAAARGKQQQMLEEKGRITFSLSSFPSVESPSRGNHVQMVEWLEENGCPCGGAQHGSESGSERSAEHIGTPPRVRALGQLPLVSQGLTPPTRKEIRGFEASVQ
jgi:hypothetical protein